MASIKRFLKLVAGWVLVSLGVAGWFTPVLPGTPLIFLGLALLSSQSEWVRNKIQSLKVRYPRQASKFEAIKEGLMSKFGEEGRP